MILHADGNSFYASCEQIYRPDLRNKPVAVLSNNDGIIVALNKEAKDCGIKRGDPYFKVKDICDYKGVTIFSSNYTLYADISRRITSIYMEYAPDIEYYSIDESFLFFDKCNWSIKDYEDIGWELKERIYKEVGIPIWVPALLKLSPSFTTKKQRSTEEFSSIIRTKLIPCSQKLTAQQSGESVRHGLKSFCSMELKMHSCSSTCLYAMQKDFSHPRASRLLWN